MENDVLEYQVLSAIRDRTQFKKYANLLKEELFESKETKRIFKVIVKHHTDYKNQLITTKSLQALIDGTVKEEARPKYAKLMIKLRKNVVEKEIVDDLINRFVRNQWLKAALMEGVNQLDAGEEQDLERVQQKLSQAIGIVQASTEETSFDYFIDPHRRIDYEKSEFRLATKLSSRIDNAIDGGLAAGEIGILIAPLGVGKSLCLCNIAYAAIQQGKKVIYATLELHARKVARRLDIRLTGRSYDDIKSDPRLVKNKLRALSTSGAGLQIKDYTSSICTVADLRAYIERRKEQGFAPDLVIVDHADLMHSIRQYKEHRYELSSIVAGLRRMGSEFGIPIWTASQANRVAMQTKKTQLHNISEDIGKAQWADVAITMSQSEEEKEDGIMHLHVAKNRIGKDNPQVVVFVNYDTLKVCGREEVRMKSMKRKLRDG